ncbi:hypothetical protein [Enterobacter kobei]|uniref:hypothetical protein n=1 Tax=Enterobacter kobei TaxID=208224 RepID=UPI0032671381
MALLKKKHSINLDEAIEAGTPLGISKTSDYYYLLHLYRDYNSCLEQDAKTVANDLNRVFVSYEAFNKHAPVLMAREPKPCEICNTSSGNDEGKLNTSEKFWKELILRLHERTAEEKLIKKMKSTKIIRNKLLDSFGYGADDGSKFDKYAELYTKIKR